MTPSGSRSDEPRMHANGANAPFVPGERSHFQIVALLRLFVGCGLGAACHFPSMRRHGSSELCGSSEMAGRSWRPPCLPPQASIKKPRRGGQPRGGVLWARGGSEGHVPPSRLLTCFHQRRWLSVRFATLEPGNCFEYPHVWSCPLPRRTGWRVSLEQHLLRRRARNGQTTWMTPRTAPPRSPLCARPCATAARRRRSSCWRRVAT